VIFGERIQIGKEIQSEVDGDILLHHADCEFEICTGCGQLIAPGEECYHDYGAGEVGVFCPKCDEFEDECCPQIGPRRHPTRPYSLRRWSSCDECERPSRAHLRPRGPYEQHRSDCRDGRH
jgi:hypothetical protein